jgi:hypothetical protein
MRSGLASANLPFATIVREVWNGGDLVEFSLSANGPKSEQHGACAGQLAFVCGPGAAAQPCIVTAPCRVTERI